MKTKQSTEKLNRAPARENICRNMLREGRQNVYVPARNCWENSTRTAVMHCRWDYIIILAYLGNKGYESSFFHYCGELLKSLYNKPKHLHISMSENSHCKNISVTQTNFLQMKLDSIPRLYKNLFTYWLHVEKLIFHIFHYAVVKIEVLFTCIGTSCCRYLLFKKSCTRIRLITCRTVKLYLFQ